MPEFFKKTILMVTSRLQIDTLFLSSSIAGFDLHLQLLLGKFWLVVLSLQIVCERGNCLSDKTFYDARLDNREKADIFYPNFSLKAC